MSYITHLKSLAGERRANEIKGRILETQSVLLNDDSRTRLLNENELNSWNEIDDITLEKVLFDEAASACVAQIYWESHGDDDDDKMMYGNATATIADDESVSFTGATAHFEK